MPDTKYVKLPGSERQPMPGSTKAGPVDPNAIIRVTLTLRARKVTGKQPTLDKLIASGQRVTREQYAANYGADPADVKKVAAFATANGLAVAQTDLTARSVVLTGKTADFVKAFQVNLACYDHDGGSYRGRTGTISIPSDLKDIVVGVHGLDDRPQARAQFRLKTGADPSATGGSLTALQVAKAYSFPTTVTGSGQTVGIIELGGGFTQSDLDSYFKGLSISPSPSVVAISVDGVQNAPTGDTNGPDTEVMLDIEVVGAVAPGASIAVYFAPNTDAGFLDAINQAVNDTVHKPSVISISWGGPESTWTAQSLQSYNSALQAAAAVGVTVCVASGDNGSTDGVTDGADHVDFPASSPYSLACGGTSLIVSGNTVSSEVVWNDLSTGNGATGGGVSTTFALPTWQSGAKVPKAGSFSGRGIPDVSGDADPATGYIVQVDGSSFTVGGTSAVAPLWAGLLALCNQSLGKSVGYLNPPLYQTIALEAGTFHDITSGNNGSFSAGKGWDACTGWGSPNGAGLLNALAGGTATTPPPTQPPTPPPTPPPVKPPKLPKPPKKHKPPKPSKPTKKATKPAPKKKAAKAVAKKAGRKAAAKKKAKPVAKKKSAASKKNAAKKSSKKR